MPGFFYDTIKDKNIRIRRERKVLMPYEGQFELAHYMALVLVYVGATIHIIILQEYRYYYHHKLTTNE
jgi:hypothetical protein